MSGAALLIASCGVVDSSSDSSNPVVESVVPADIGTEPATSEPDITEPGTTEIDDATPDTAATNASTLQAVRGAVIQIEAQGTFVDPEFGASEGAGRGSGFVISDGNLAVTNNHVVTGAGLLKVWVDGEDDPRNARVLGVSECSDLAVIEIDGAAIPSLEWAGAIDEPGTEVYVAGFPLGDPEYTLTRGVIAKARADGDSNWASVDHTIEHDAAAQPGNSGGPLVTADGKVAGIHYASASETNQSQFLAIAGDIAEPIVDQLADGDDVDSVGINGQIVVSEAEGIAGLWVAGVKSGSPADEAGIEPGDIVTRMEGVSIGTDGTMKDYCDVLRSHAPDDQLAVEVLRFATSEVLGGELNGDVLTQSFSFAEEYSDDPATAPGEAYGEYVAISDDTETITVTIPAVWADIDGSSLDLGDSAPAPSITASTDLTAYRESWTVPGMEFIASSTLASSSPGEMLDLVAPDECISQGRDAYDDGFFVGEFEQFTDCGGSTTQFIVVAATSADGAYGVLVAVQIVTDADLDALDAILASFNVTV